MWYLSKKLTVARVLVRAVARHDNGVVLGFLLDGRGGGSQGQEGGDEDAGEAHLG